MTLERSGARWASTIILLTGVSLLAPPMVLAQDSGDQDSQQEMSDESVMEEVTVTGSRIKRSAADQMSPIGTVDREVFDQRGYVSAAEALNYVTANTPMLNQAAGDGSSSGTGQQFPDLLGLGTGRTLTLVNGNRFVTSSVGLGDAQVDANIIPTGLVDRIEVSLAGGAAVYGSDAIAGVVNYILREDFEGLTFDAQYGWAEHGDYDQENYRVTWGKNFDDGRGNVAANVEYASTPLLYFSDRERSNLSRITQSNPADTGPNDGIPAVQEILDAHFWNFNGNGIVYNIPAPPPFALTLVDGHPIQFDASGNLVPYNPGQILGIPFAQGGDGFRYSELAGLRTGVERFNMTTIGHYDLSDHITLRAQLLYSWTKGEEVPQGYPRTVLNGNQPATGAIMIFNFNPFLTPEARATLSAASPAFAAGAPLWLSRHFYYDLFPSNIQETFTETYYALFGAEGDFEAMGRDWDWTAHVSFGQVDGDTSAWDADVAKFNNALFAIPGPNGPACLINVDGNPTNDDPACSPINPFGAGNISAQASNYVSVPVGLDWSNDQLDILATLGTSLFTLPGGDVETVFAYEHRSEDAHFTPYEANQLGLTGVGVKEVPQSGSYDTDELSAELLVPILGEDMNIPGVKALDFNGTYRWVDNSIAGSESVWSAGLRWQVLDSFALRATWSRNFRAPTLTQLLAPSATGLDSIGDDPCDSDNINGGPDPATRRANCEAEWAANPQYGDLDGFQDPSENFTYALVTTGGNPNLRNEISDATTYGIVLQPGFAPGFTLTADWIEIDLTDGLSAFETQDFMAVCYDNSTRPTEVCGAFERASDATEQYPAGTVVRGLTTTFNAGVVEYQGEYYTAAYETSLSEVFGHDSFLALTLAATHNSKYSTSVTGSAFVREDNTVALPDWITRFTANWGIGPVTLSYQLYYLSAVLSAPDATIETTPNPDIDSNVVQDFSVQWAINDMFSVRAGVNNFMDEEPSYPTISHGDIIGRRWFVGATAHFE